MKTERPNETANRVEPSYAANRVEPLYAANRVEPFYAANRREFLRGGARYVLLAGLAAVSAVLVKRHGASLPGQTCINQGICRGCGAFEDCGLPQALSAKQVLQSSRSSRRESAQTFSGINQSRLTSAATNLEKGGSS